jgi:hypothetical protein
MTQCGGGIVILRHSSGAVAYDATTLRVALGRAGLRKRRPGEATTLRIAPASCRDDASRPPGMMLRITP